MTAGYSLLRLLFVIAMRSLVRDLLSTGEAKERRGHEHPDLHQRASPTANRRCGNKRRNDEES
jgi:hypothetical protein